MTPPWGADRREAFNRRARESVDALVRTFGADGAEVVVSKIPCHLVSLDTGRLRRAVLRDGRLVEAGPADRPTIRKPAD